MPAFLRRPRHFDDRRTLDLKRLPKPFRLRDAKERRQYIIRRGNDGQSYRGGAKVALFSTALLSTTGALLFEATCLSCLARQIAETLFNKTLIRSQ